MKKVRIMSNLIADELKTALDESGIQLDEDVFEGQVSDIVEMVSESVKKACEGEDCDDEDIEESFYYVNTGFAVGDSEAEEGDFIEIEDGEEGSKIVTVYDSEGEVKLEGIVVSSDDVDAFFDNLEEIEEDEEDLEESKVNEIEDRAARKLAAKMRAKGKTATGNKKLKGAALAKFKKSHKGLWKSNTRKKAAKTFHRTKNKHLAAGQDSGTCTVKEGFDITANGIKLSLEPGDEIAFEDGKITVTRDGKVIFSDVQVSENFMDRCFEEAVLEKKCNEEDDDEEEKKDAEAEAEDVEAEAGEEENPEDSDDEEDDDKDVDECGTAKTNEEDEEPEEEEVEEGAMLTFKANKGFVLVSEGTELPMGNRIRARATLTSKGYKVTSEMLDNASAGKVVVL